MKMGKVLFESTFPKEYKRNSTSFPSIDYYIMVVKLENKKCMLYIYE